jgi:uncharacterized protein (DUF2252 family)
MRHYRPVDVAVKVVGVGSVGTRCLVLLLAGEDLGDPLLLQIKEAVASVLETAAEPTRYGNQGQRVVEGQHLMQATSDIFLGWTSSDEGRDFYWRQLKDMKGSADIAAMDPERMQLYAALCGATLARAHAKTGDRISIAGYLGSGDVFDRAVADFARAYADQAEADYRSFLAAIDAGRLEATPGT